MLSVKILNTRLEWFANASGEKKRFITQGLRVRERGRRRKQRMRWRDGVLVNMLKLRLIGEDAVDRISWWQVSSYTGMRE